MFPTETSPLLSFRLVLVEPRVSGNIGACGRVAANFDLRDWMIVNPKSGWDGPEARKFATGTADRYLDAIRTVGSLREATASCQASVGFTRRHGKMRTPSIELGEVALLSASHGKVALVFGNEETGLTREELESCTHLCTLATSDSMASLNLSHAVAVVLARVFEQRIQAQAPQSLRGSTTPASLEHFSAMMDHWRDFLLDIGLNRAGNPDRLLRVLRKAFGRARLNRRELSIFRGILSKAQVRLGTRRRGRKILSQPESG